MTKQIIKIYNIETSQEIEREMNAEELAQFEADEAKAIAQAEADSVKAATRQALLDRLGITADEAALLLG